MKIHPSLLALIIWFGLILGCAPQNSQRQSSPAKERPSPGPAISADPHAKLVWAKNALEKKEFDEAIEQLNQIDETAPEYKEAQALLPKAKRDRDEQRKRDAPAKREELRGKYERLVQEANPQLNFIQSKFTKIKGGYALWAVHEYFSQYSFSIGPDGKIVQEWVSENRDDLLAAEIVRVGVMGKGGFASWVYFDVR